MSHVPIASRRNGVLAAIAACSCGWTPQRWEVDTDRAFSLHVAMARVQRTPLEQPMSCHAGADHGPARKYAHGWLCDACWCWLYLRGWARLHEAA